MKIKMKMSVAGTFHNIDAGVVVGQVVDIDDAEAARYVALGYAEAVKPGRLSEEHAIAALSNEERAVLSTEIVGASDKPVPQPKAPRPPKVEVGDGKVEEVKAPAPKTVTTKDVPTPTKRVTTAVRRPRK